MSKANAKLLDKLSIFKSIPIWILAVMLALSVIFTIYSLRQNNQEMIKLRTAVFAADESNGNVEKALSDLRRYVYSHMNTNLSSGGNAIKPPIQLKYTYERLQAAETARVQAVNAQVYTEGQAYCEAQNPGSVSGRNRVPCVESYVTTHGVSPQTVPASLYQYDFVSPSWSPDKAGWGLAISVMLALTMLTVFISDRYIKSKLNPL